MTSATLFREGDDLDELLADLDDEHPGQVRVVEVTYDRDGGVLGFFARRKVGVHYVVDGVGDGAGDGVRDTAASATTTARNGSTVNGSALNGSALNGSARVAGTAPAARRASREDLRRAAEMVESGRVPDAEPDSAGSNVEFARMLLDLAAQKAADRLANGEPAALPFQDTLAVATTAAEKFVADTVADTVADDTFAADSFAADPFVVDSFTVETPAAAPIRPAATAAPVRSASQVAAAKFATAQFAVTAAPAGETTIGMTIAETTVAETAVPASVAATPAAELSTGQLPVATSVPAPLPPAPPVRPSSAVAPPAPIAPVAPQAPIAPVAPTAHQAPILRHAPSAPQARISPIAPPAPAAAAVRVAPTPPPARPVPAPVISASAPIAATPTANITPVPATAGGAQVVAASDVISRLAAGSTPQPGGRRRAAEPEPQHQPIAATAEPARRSGAHRAAPESGRSQFHVRRQLSEVGVPVAWIPEECGDAYWAIETLVGALPTATLPDPGPGDVVVVVGTGVEALDAARQLCTRLRLDPAAIHTAGCTGPQEELTHRWQAAALGSRVRAERGAPAVVVVATDDRRAGDDSDDRWVASMVRALGPEHLLAVVDASRKAADCRVLLAAIGPVDALWLTGAGRTSSPASVWELDVPVAMLDGRPATRGAWAALLIDKLIALES